MKVRHKGAEIEWFSSNFNVHALGEILIGRVDLGMDSVYIKDFDVFLEKTHLWKDMGQAFKDHDIIIDNYNTMFFEPSDDVDRERGYTLDP